MSLETPPSEIIPQGATIEVLEPIPPAAPASNLSQWALIRRRFAHHKLALWSLYVLIVLYLGACFVEAIAPQDPNKRNVDFSYCPPQLIRWTPSDGLYVPAMARQVDPVTLRVSYVRHDDQIVRLGLWVRGDDYKLWGLIPMNHHLLGMLPAKDLAEASQLSFYPLGADKYGRDLMSRIVYGARVSLSVGLIGVAVTFLLGMTIGGISGYVGGRTDMFVQRTIEVVNSFPQLPLWIALGAALPADWSPLRVYFAITVLLSLLGWTGLARVVRGKILSLREEDYALAARLLGASHSRVLFKHLLPGFTSHVIVALSLSVPGMILAETSLSFLGLGLRPPVVSWGVMLQDCMDVQAIRYYPWLMAPVFPIIFTVLAFNFVGDGMRDASDPYASN
ncbi:MAG: ABC transporter permease [Tepidisphaeraceae bacterium]